MTSDSDVVISSVHSLLTRAVEWLLGTWESLSCNNLVEKSRGRRGFKYKAVAMVHLLICDDHLCGGMHLKVVLLHAITAVCPAMHSLIKKMLETHAVPGKSSLSKARLAFDVAFMLYARQRNLKPLQTCFESKPGHDSLDHLEFRTMLADGSPQGGKEFLLVEQVTIRGADIIPMCEA